MQIIPNGSINEKNSRPGFDILRIPQYVKEPVLDFLNVAKCDQLNGEVGDIRKAWVLGIRQRGKSGRECKSVVLVGRTGPPGR